MAEENVFKEELNGKALIIDAIKTIIATAIGLMFGLLMDKTTEKIQNRANYQQIIVATINNLEDYQTQIENLQNWMQYACDYIGSLSEEEYDPTDPSTIEEFDYVFFTQNFRQQDKWIEENFITNGNFIENTDLRLKIGSVYSTINLCQKDIEALKQEAEKEYGAHLDRYIDDKTHCIETTLNDNHFLRYYVKLGTTNEQIKQYLGIIKDLNAEIIKISDADQEELQKMRESSKRINEILNKERNTNDEE